MLSDMPWTGSPNLAETKPPQGELEARIRGKGPGGPVPAGATAVLSKRVALGLKTPLRMGVTQTTEACRGADGKMQH